MAVYWKLTVTVLVRLEDVQRLALRGERDASRERGNAVHRGPELIADGQVPVGVDALCPERI